jgi:hypothetical protein
LILIISLTNNVANIHLICMYNIMKVELLLNDCNNQLSRISESVAETRANLNLARWQHDTREASETPHVATVRDNDQKVGPGPTFL